MNQQPSGDGPNVIPDPDRAEFIQRAFEMMATGLHSKAEILRTITQHGLTNATGKPLPMQTFQKVLVNPFYAGWMQFSDHEDLIQGSHMPLVSRELFDKVQDILAGRRPQLTGYEKQRSEFPLRVFVRCRKCGTPLTGSFSTGRRNKYPYYRCRQNCEAVAAKPDDVHAKFINWLGRMAPDPASLPALKETILAVWKERIGDAEKLRSALTRKLSQIEARKNTLTNKWLDDKLDDATYNEHRVRLTAEIDSERGELRGTQLDDIEIDQVLDFAEKIILRPARLWVESSLDQKQRLQQTLFPDGIEFDGKEFGTATTPLFFRLLEQELDDDYDLASPTGFEPVLSP